MPHEIPSNLQFSLKKDNKDLLDEIFKRIEKLDITKIPSSSKGLTKEISTLQRNNDIFSEIKPKENDLEIC
jgi:hypothetical protein